MKPKLLNAEPDGYDARARSILEEVAVVTEQALDRAGLLREIRSFDILIVRLGHEVDAELLKKAPRLKIVASATTGLDHVDVAAAAAAGVTVLSLKGETDFLENVTATAEHAWGLLLSLVRRLPAAHADVLAGHWRRDLFIGRELKGKTLGVIGYGRLGRKVASYGMAFGMTVLANDPQADPKAHPEARFLALKEVLAGADAVSLHVPLDGTTAGLIGRTQLAAMKPGAVLINTSRGGVIDEAALLDALESGALAGAALDVLSGEENARRGKGSWPANDPLVRYAALHDNLVLTPHVGGATSDSMAAAEIFMARKIARQIAAAETKP